MYEDIIVDFVRQGTVVMKMRVTVGSKEGKESQSSRSQAYISYGDAKLAHALALNLNFVSQQHVQQRWDCLQV